MNSRRQLLLKLLPAAGAAAMLPRLARAQDLPALTENDPLGAALGFETDTAAVDQAKFPKHTNEQRCKNCVHYTKFDASRARCDLFNKTVPQEGWCAGWVKRG